MKSTVKGLLLSLCLAAGFGISVAHAAAAKSSSSASKEEARQTAPDTPKQAYQHKVREIQAAHRDNLANCKSMPASERSACTKEAKQILKSDMADAKKEASSSRGSSGSGGTTESSESKGAKDSMK